MRVAVIIPARNEADALGAVLAELPRAPVHEVIVVDNGSTDGTAEVARRHGARVITEPIPGYGRACLVGIAALDPSVDVVVFLDGDHADYPEDLPVLLAPIAEGRAELVIGSRAARAQAGSLTRPQRFGNRLACALMRWGFGVRSTDLGPFRAIRRDALARLQMRDCAYGWTVEMQAKAARLGLRVVEVRVRYRPRIGRSKISGTVRGTIRAGWGILSTILRVAMTCRRSGLTAERQILVFLKQPIPWQVKTRIAAVVGGEKACEVYRACAGMTLERLGGWRASAVLYVEPPGAMDEIRAWVGFQWPMRPQEGEDLGERLHRAATEAFARGARQVVLIGTDAPWLSRREFDEAFDALERADLVLGPTEDGGYYLIGMNRPLPELFERMTWSTPWVYAETLKRALELGLRVHSLHLGYDVDRPEDLTRLVQLLRSERGEAMDA